jgi:membrane-bound serine protease (ClpP class)
MPWKFLIGLLFLSANCFADDSVALLTINGAIGPATTDYLVRGIDQAIDNGDQAVILQIDTPGGLDAATRDINKAILASAIPVITYVSPEGARAASAGTYILYASHVAVMAPATNLGAATPVQIIGGNQKSDDPKSEEGDNQGEENGDREAPSETGTMSRKMINDATAYIRGLAERRGRNAEWAERAVREAESISASVALEIKVIDLLAESLTDLLQQLDGREVEMAQGTVTLSTADARLNVIEPDWRNRLLARITDPTVAYLLFIIGLYGLMLEGYHPGALVPGITGAISLMLALYAFQVLPINYIGVGLILLGLALMAAEAFAPSFGTLGIGGIVALVIGSIILIDSDVPGLLVSRSLIAAIATLSGILFLGLMWMLLRTRHQPPSSGTGPLIGASGEVIDQLGRIHLRGEDWMTRSDEPLSPGDQVEVLSIDGLTLYVRKLELKGE